MKRFLFALALLVVAVVMIREAATVAMPKLLTSINVMMMRRRTGWWAMLSDSPVVKPTPVRAERAWKRADSRDRPVKAKAAVAMRVMSMEMASTISNEKTAIMRVPPFGLPQDVGPLRVSRAASFRFVHILCLHTLPF